MKILDVFRKKKEKREEKKIKPEAKPGEKIISEKLEKTEKPKEKIPSQTLPQETEKKKILGLGWRALKAPHVTEKSTDLAKENQYVFKVWPRTNKIEIKRAIEEIYGVKVLSVKTIKVPRKKRKLGKISGWRKGYKKAIVKIKKGQEIEVLPR